MYHNNYLARRTLHWLLAGALFALIALPSQHALAQCGLSLSSNLSENNGSDGIAFEITAKKTMTLCKIRAGNEGTSTLELWAHPNGLPFSKAENTNINDNQWFKLGTVTVNFAGGTPAGYTEIPIDLSVLGVMAPGQKWGFAIFATSGGFDYRTGSSPYIFQNADMSMDTEWWSINGSTGPGNNTNFQTSNAPRQFCGAISYSLITEPDDAGIASIDSPIDFCAGQHPVTVTLSNNGTNQLTSATIEWTLNGIPQPTYNWTGLLDTMDLASRTTQINLATENFLGSIPYTITAWTTNPNGVADNVPGNDTSSVTTQAALGGQFTIGGASPDYSSFSDAIADLETYGVCAPVVFKVRPGTYDEQLEIGGITGVSASNTVTFESESGLNNDVDLTFNATSDNWVVRLNSSSYIAFRNMTVTATGSSDGRVIVIENGATNTLLENLILQGRTVTSTSTNYAIIYSTDDNDDFTTIRGCTFLNGSYGMYWQGDGSSSLERGTVLENNTFLDFYSNGILFQYLDACIIRGNTFSTASTNGGQELIHVDDSDNDIQIVGNILTVRPGGDGDKQGIEFDDHDGSASNKALVANNFITIYNGSDDAYGLYPDNSDNVKFYNNTVYINSTNSNSRALFSEDGDGLEYLNNILIVDGSGYAYYTDRPTAIDASDYNVLQTNGSRIGYWSGSRSTLADFQAANGMDQNSISKNVFFADETTGDLHLTGASQDDLDLTGMLLADVPKDIDDENRVVPFRGADEACYILDGTVSYELVDAAGVQTPYANSPGQIGVSYNISFPEFASTVTVTLRLYSVPNNNLVFTGSFQADKQFGITLSGYQLIALDNVPAGTYRAQVTFNTKNSCDSFTDYVGISKALVVLDAGELPCIVWPGDVTNDGIVNYGDLKAFNQYVHDANLSPIWLNGPSRYRADAGTNPLTYLRWEAQASMPWGTAQGCYMDCDGNGIVNSFDIIAIRLNWFRTHGIAPPKDNKQFDANTFDISANYPNPFNPSTTMEYSVPERSRVELEIYDVNGRIIETLVNETKEAGVYTAQFTAENLSSGLYLAVVRMQGIESGLTFSKAVEMTLTK
ncbi:MAG: hypothetical protein CL946_12970 [Ectothiorhodospiraceae bacterium]|nr:hypothetical protein [Ectothiorhodospiraceae bacterium]